MKLYAPIVLFAYNRPDHIRRTLETLSANDLASDSDLIIFADGPKLNADEEQIKRIVAVRDILANISGFKSVRLHLSPVNKGLANSVIDGVSQVITKYGRAIVVEDDLETSPSFLRFMNEALEYYEQDKRIFTIGGYNYPLRVPVSYKHDIYASYRCESWGWATWADRWILANWNTSSYSILKDPTKRAIKKFNRGGDDLYDMLLDWVNGRNDSWAIRWQNCLYEHNGWCISPIKTFVKNIGFDGTGANCGVNQEHNSASMFEGEYRIEWVVGLKPCKPIVNAVADYFRIQRVSKWKRCKRSLINIIKHYAQHLVKKNQKIIQ